MSSPIRLSATDSPGRTPRRQIQSRSPSAFGTPRKYLF